MAFQIKDFVSIVAGMVNHMRGHQTELTDFNIGAVNRTMIEAVAVEVDQCYQQLVNGIREAIPVATYRSFNFERLPAAAASGLIRVTLSGSATENVVVPSGTLFSGSTAKASYRSVTDAIIVQGTTTADVLVTAVQPGVIGNIVANETFSLGPVPQTFVSATNLTAIDNGVEVEDDDQRKERFVAYINTLQRATTAALDYGARTVVLRTPEGAETERVRSCRVIEPYLTDSAAPISLVEVVIHNGVGSTSDDLVDETSKILHGYTDDNGQKVPGWKAAGVKVVVLKATEKVLNIAAVLTAKPGYSASSLAGQAETVLAEYIGSIQIGDAFLRSQAIFLVKSLEGVNDFVFTDPNDNVTSDQDEKLLVGTLAVTAA